MRGGPFVFSGLRRDAPDVFHSFEGLRNQSHAEPAALQQIPFFRTRGEKFSLYVLREGAHRAVRLYSLEYRHWKTRVEHIVRQ